MKSFKTVFSLSALLGLAYTGSLCALVKLAGNDRFSITETYICAMVLMFSLAFVGRVSFMVYAHLMKRLKCKDMLVNSFLTSLVSLGLATILFTFFKSILSIPLFLMAGVLPNILLFMLLDKIYLILGKLIRY